MATGQVCRVPGCQATLKVLESAGFAGEQSMRTEGRQKAGTWVTVTMFKAHCQGKRIARMGKRDEVCLCIGDLKP